MQTSLVSIIIPTFNRVHLISETLDRVLTQPYNNSESIVLDDGSVEATVEYYLVGNSESKNCKVLSSVYDKNEFTLHEININPVGQSSDFVLDENTTIEIYTRLTLKENDKNLYIIYVLNNENGEVLFTFSHCGNNLKLKPGCNKLKCTLPKGFLNIGTYYLAFYIIENSKTTLFVEKDIMMFNVQYGERAIGSWLGREPGFIKPVFNWIIE